MNEIQIFTNELFGSVRTLEQNDGKVLFCGADVAKALGYSDTPKAIKAHCKADGWVICPVIDSMGRTQDAKFITEGNLYRLITHSKLPDAEKFERWVFDKILPSIHKHGAYMTEQTLEKALTSPDFLIQLATELKTEKEKRLQLEQQAEQDKPKVLFADAVTASETSILVREFAKTCKQNGIEVGEKRLFEWLRENGYLIRKVGSDYNTPTQRAMEQGLFEVKKTAVHHASGEVTIGKTPKITGKGQIYFLNKLKEASEHNKQKVELWRATADQRIRAYCKQSHINHMKFRKDLYGQLEKDFGFAFQDLLVILRQKRKKEGMTYKQCAALTNLDVIAANRALRDAFAQAMETVEASAQQMTL